MEVVRLGPGDVEELRDLLADHIDHDGGDLLVAWDPIDEAIRAKVGGRWCRPLGKANQS